MFWLNCVYFCKCIKHTGHLFLFNWWSVINLFIISLFWWQISATQSGSVSLKLFLQAQQHSSWPENGFYLSVQSDKGNMILDIFLSCASAFLSAFSFFTQCQDFRWCLELQRVRTVLWTWTVRLEICSVLRMLIQPVQVELEFWQSKGTIRAWKVIFVCAISVQFFSPNVFPHFVILFFTSCGNFAVYIFPDWGSPKDSQPA